MDERSGRRKRRGPRSPVGRSRGMKLPADVTFKSILRGGFRDVDADIGADHLARLAAAGGVPAELHVALREHARLLVIDLSTMIEDLGAQRTRSQLRHELIDLLRALKRGGEMSVVPACGWRLQPLEASTIGLDGAYWGKRSQVSSKTIFARSASMCGRNSVCKALETFT